MGRLSPLDGVGGRDIGLASCSRASDGIVDEVILATNFTTAEGEATAHVIGEALRARRAQQRAAAACRSAANSSTWTWARSRMPCRTGAERR